MKKLLTTMLIFFTLTTGIFSKESKPIHIAALKGPTGLSMAKFIEANMPMGAPTEYSVVSTPQLLTAGLLSGSYDIAALPTNLAAIIFNKKPDYVLAAVTGEGMLYVISSRDDIKEWDDLKNKKVYNIARSSTPGFLFNHLLKENSIDPESDLDIDFTFNHIELAPMLIAGKVETGILPEPLITNVMLKNPKMKVVLDFQKEYANGAETSYPLSCIVIKKSLIEENPKVVSIYLEELEKSINWVKANPTDAGEIGNKIGLGVTGTIVKKSIDRMNIGFQSAADAKASLDNYYRVLFDSDPKSVGGTIPGADFYLD